MGFGEVKYFVIGNKSGVLGVLLPNGQTGDRINSESRLRQHSIHSDGHVSYAGVNSDNTEGGMSFLLDWGERKRVVEGSSQLAR